MRLTKMNLRNNKGYAGIDIGVATIILVILIPFIGGMIYNISKNNKQMDMKTYAINLASNVLEVTKSTNIEYLYSNLEDKPETSDTGETYLTNLNNKIENRITDANVQSEGGKEYIIFSVQDSKKNHYKIVIDILDLAKEDTTKQENVVKTAKVTITYSLANNLETIEMSTVIAKE